MKSTNKTGTAFININNELDEKQTRKNILFTKSLSWVWWCALKIVRNKLKRQQTSIKKSTTEKGIKLWGNFGLVELIL